MLVQVTEVVMLTRHGRLVCFHLLKLIQAFFFFLQSFESLSQSPGARGNPFVHTTSTHCQSSTE